MVESLHLRMLWTTGTWPQYQSSRSNVFPISKCLETFQKSIRKNSRYSLEPCSTASNHIQPHTTVEPHWTAYNHEKSRNLSDFKLSPYRLEDLANDFPLNYFRKYSECSIVPDWNYCSYGPSGIIEWWSHYDIIMTSS